MRLKGFAKVRESNASLSRYGTADRKRSQCVPIKGCVYPIFADFMFLLRVPLESSYDLFQQFPHLRWFQGLDVKCADGVLHFRRKRGGQHLLAGGSKRPSQKGEYKQQTPHSKCKGAKYSALCKTILLLSSFLQPQNRFWRGLHLGDGAHTDTHILHTGTKQINKLTSTITKNL